MASRLRLCCVIPKLCGIPFLRSSLRMRTSSICFLSFHTALSPTLLGFSFVNLGLPAYSQASWRVGFQTEHHRKEGNKEMEMSTDRKVWKVMTKTLCATEAEGNRTIWMVNYIRLIKRVSFSEERWERKRRNPVTKREELPLAIRETPIIRTVPKGQLQIYKIRVPGHTNLTTCLVWKQHHLPVRTGLLFS